jgi:hypothetical protein
MEWPAQDPAGQLVGTELNLGDDGTYGDICEIDFETGLKIALEVFHTRDPDVRVMTTGVLSGLYSSAAKSNDRQAMDTIRATLTGAMNDPEGEVRSAAKDALSGIDREDGD